MAIDPEAVRAAIKKTEYKYFGDYEFSPDQREAVDTLVAYAKQGLALSHPANIETLYEIAKDAWNKRFAEGETTVRDCVTTIVDAVLRATPTQVEKGGAE